MTKLHYSNLALADARPMARRPLAVVAAGQSLLPSVAALAQAYPLPHSLFGRPEAAAYVRKLASQVKHDGEGWYGVIGGDGGGSAIVAAGHLSIYGIGDGSGHTLWKIRHPLLADGEAPGRLALLFRGLIDAARWSRRGSAKFVLFASEHEREAISEVVEAGFRREACFKDYYRLGETCFVYSRTVV